MSAIFNKAPKQVHQAAAWFDKASPEERRERFAIMAGISTLALCSWADRADLTPHERHASSLLAFFLADMGVTP